MTLERVMESELYTLSSGAVSVRDVLFSPLK